MNIIGHPRFLSREQVMSHLVYGTLVVEIRMKENERPPAPFVPENPSACKIIRRLFMDKEFSDVVFEVGGGKLPKDEAKSKAIKTSSTTFFAHYAIVKEAAPKLAELCKSGKNGSPSLVQIADVTSDVFHCVLMYIYGFEIPSTGFEVSHLKEIIEAADKYGVTSLKLEAEARYVKSTTFSIDNVVDHLLFAESNVCALLKEAVMDFIVVNKAEILEKKTLMDAPAIHMNDILAAMARGEKEVHGKHDRPPESGFGSMRISELRERAYARGLDVDGTREMLISALEVDSSVDSSIEIVVASELSGRAHARGLDVDGTREMPLSALEVDLSTDSSVEIVVTSELSGGAHARGLDVDGTRKMLISALEVDSSIDSSVEIVVANELRGRAHARGLMTMGQGKY